MLYSVLRPLARIALGWYYESVEAVGLERIPLRGPVFLAGNHPNALMDALVIGVLVPRPVRMLAKATLFENPVAGAVLRAAGVIPLHRARDVAPDIAQHVAADLSRNAHSFRAVADALATNGAVVIFPEGTSHDDPQLAPIRTGLARMALEARDVHAVHDITIVPLGLVFEAKETPRTRVLLQVGEPLRLNDWPAEHTSVAALTSEIHRRLRDVTLNFSSPEESARLLTLAHALGVLFTPTRRIGAESYRLADVVQLVKRIHRAASRITGEFQIVEAVPSSALHTTGSMRIGARDVKLTTRVQQFEQRFAALLTQLTRERLAVEDVAVEPGSGAGARFAIREGVLALVRGPIGVWGRVNHWLPITLTRTLALRGVKSRDEPAMRSVLFGLMLVLTFYALQTSLVAWLLGGWWALAYAITLVPSASSDFRYGDRTRRARERARAYFRFRKEPALQRALMAEAAWVREEAVALEAIMLAMNPTTEYPIPEPASPPSAADTDRPGPSATRVAAPPSGDP